MNYANAIQFWQQNIIPLPLGIKTIIIMLSCASFVITIFLVWQMLKTLCRVTLDAAFRALLGITRENLHQLILQNSYLQKKNVKLRQRLAKYKERARLNKHLNKTLKKTIKRLEKINNKHLKNCKASVTIIPPHHDTAQDDDGDLPGYNNYDDVTDEDSDNLDDDSIQQRLNKLAEEGVEYRP